MGGQENGNFPLLMRVKMSLHRWVVQKSLKTPLRNIKMAPYGQFWLDIRPPFDLFELFRIFVII